MNAIRFLISGLGGCSLSPMLYNLIVPARTFRGVLRFNNLALSFGRSNTTKFSKSFIPAITRLWNDMPNHVDSVQLQNLKRSANAYLLSRHL